MDLPTRMACSLSSSDEENIADLSMKKKNIQHERNIKRRKTVKTHDEIELDKDCQKAGKPAEKSVEKDKNKGKAPNQEQIEQLPQDHDKKSTPREARVEAHPHG
ncbi:hypothetical protein JTB14_025472 [Gonioctena quinquepunctata]|nr:hypothetical protein JTB14_025472 [Gonioctena quinquepunctata]